MKRANAIAIAGAVVLLAQSAGAKPIEEKQVLSGKVQMDPTSGYIFISADQRQFGYFLRLPDGETRRDHEADRLKAFEKAMKRYPMQLARWRKDLAVANASQRKIPEQPEQPKLETFSIDPIELRDAVSFGPMYAYSKDNRVSYMEAVKPGTWIWYGPVMVGANGAAMGSCYCLGTIRFEVKPGVITDLGSSLSDAPKWSEEMDVARLQLKQRNAERIAAGKEPLATLSTGAPRFGLPPSLAKWPSVRAQLQASPKMNNYFGLVVTRVAPIPGVLAYRRDTIVDARTGQEVDSPTLVSRARIKK